MIIRANAGSAFSAAAATIAVAIDDYCRLVQRVEAVGTIYGMVPVGHKYSVHSSGLS
jgi:hypothetical protein